MQIICNKALQFLKTEIKPNQVTGENVAVHTDTFTVTPSTTPQVVPDWIKEDSLFELSVNSGTIIEVAVLSQPKKTVEEPAELGWGASANGLQVGKAAKGK